jgi:hypothetical protein
MKHLKLLVIQEWRAFHLYLARPRGFEHLTSLICWELPKRAHVPMSPFFQNDYRLHWPLGLSPVRPLLLTRAYPQLT